MRVLHRVWHEVRHGRNIDLYATLLLSAVVLTLSLLNVAPQSLVLSLMLAVLAVLAVGSLVQRSQNDRIEALLRALDVRVSASSFFAQHNIAEVLDNVRLASSVYLWGSSLRTNLPLFEEAIEAGLRLGRTYRVLLIKPGGAAVQMAAVRWPSISVEEIELTLSSNIARLRRLRKLGLPGTIDARVIDDANPYVMYVFDADKPDGRLMIRLVSFAASK